MRKQLLKIKYISANISSKNFFNLSLNQGTNVLVALIVTPYLYQTLGEEEYGLVNLGFTVVMLFTILVNYGFHLNGPKRLALIKNQQEKSELINEVIFTRLALAVTLIFLLISLTSFLHIFDEYKTILLFSLIILINESVFPMFILQGLDKISWISKANVISKVLYLLFVLVIVKSPADSKWVNFLIGGSALLVNVSLLFLIYQKERVTFKWVKLKALLSRLRENFQFFLSTIAGHISIHGGLVVLSNFISDFELGQYALAQRVAFLLRMIPVFIVQSILQSATRLFDDGEEKFGQYLKKIHGGGLLLTGFLGIAVVLGSTVVIRVVGGQYIDYSAKILRILAFIPFLSTLNVANIIKILVKEQKALLARATWVTAGFMVLLSIIGSYFFGGVGMAMALVLTEIIGFFTHYWLLKKS